MKNSKSKKLLPILFFAILSLSVLAGSRFLQSRNHISRSFNIVDEHFSQFSDKNITQAAMVADPSFQRMAFASAPRQDKVLPDQFASVFRAFRLLFADKQKKGPEEYGTWIWTPILQMNEEYMRTIIGGAKEQGVNVLYLSIDSYLDIYTLPDSLDKEKKKKQFSDVLDQFLSIAKESGIVVDAEAGWRNWAEPGHMYKPFAVVNFVKNFNVSHTHKFRGFQYDVEPYMLPGYKSSTEGKQEALTNFTKLVDDTVYYLRGSDLKFSVVVPDFYDKYDDMTPRFEYADKNDYAFGHLLTVLDKRLGSSIIIMSYRNFAEGSDGSIDVSKNEMRTASRGRFYTQIVLAQETGDVEPAYITFHGTSKEYLNEQTTKLRSAFSSDRNFAGLAIHYANAYLELK